MAYQEKSYLGTGKVFLEEEGATTGLLFAGLVDELTLGIETESKDLKDLTQPGGGLYNSVERVSAMKASMKLREFALRNLAIALYGATAAVTAGAVTDETHVAYPGALIKFNNIPNSTLTVTVTDNAGTTTYVENTDYVRTAAGIEILEGGTIVAASTIKVDYTKVAGSVVQALVNSGKTFRLFFQGINEAQSGKPFLVDLFRVKFSPAAALNLITEDFGELQLEGKVLADQNKTGAGISRYAKIEEAA